MSQKNIDRLRSSLDVFNRTGEIVEDHLAPDFEMQQASSIIDTAGTFRGPKGLQNALLELRESFDELSFNPAKFCEAPGGEIVAFIRVRGRGRGSGMAIDNEIAWVWTVRDDKAVRCVVYEEPADALQAVGLSQQDAHADS